MADKSHKENVLLLKTQVNEKTSKIIQLEHDQDSLQKKYSELQRAKVELEHEYDSVLDQIQRVRSMMLGVGTSNKKRRLSET